MIGKVLITIYSIALSFIAVACIAITWANDPISIFIIEILVNFIIVAGCWLALSPKQYKWWLVIVILVIACEAYLLKIEPTVGIRETMEWTVILLPALFLNLKVAGIVKYRKLLKEKSA